MPHRVLACSDINAIVFSPNSKRFVVAASWFEVKDDDILDQIWLFDSSGKKLKRVAYGYRPSWSPDGRYLMYISRRGREIKRYDFQTGKTVTLIQGTSDLLLGAVYSPSGKMIAVMGLCEFLKGEHDGLFLTDSKGHFLRYVEDDSKLSNGLGKGYIAW